MLIHQASIFCLPVWCDDAMSISLCVKSMCRSQFTLHRHHLFNYSHVNQSLKMNVVKINSTCIKLTTFHYLTLRILSSPACQPQPSLQPTPRKPNLFPHLTAVPGPAKSHWPAAAFFKLILRPDKLLSVIYGSVSVSVAPVLGDFYTLLWQMTTLAA